jgi:NADH:ubiquinone oxidoreductase subunit 3 (subunit A)
MANNLFFACCIAVGLALLPFPYLFYILLKILFFVSIIYYAIAIYQGNFDIRISILIVLAILYNPIIAVHLGSKLLWFVINVLTLVFMYNIKDKIDYKNTK